MIPGSLYFVELVGSIRSRRLLLALLAILIITRRTTPEAEARSALARRGGILWLGEAGFAEEGSARAKDECHFRVKVARANPVKMGVAAELVIVEPLLRRASLLYGLLHWRWIGVLDHFLAMHVLDGSAEHDKETQPKSQGFHGGVLSAGT